MTDSPFVALYLRKSRDKAEMADPDLLHKHRREGLRWAAERNLAIVPEHIFEEIGSGERLSSRLVCQALLAEIKRLSRGAGGYLWTTEVARLTRGSLADRAVVYGALSHAGIRHCTREGEFNLANPHQLRSWEERASSASYELGVFKERIEAARLDMALEGRIPTGKPPFGWWWNRNARDEQDKLCSRVEPDPAEFPIVQAICADALDLSTYRLSAKYGLPQPVIYNLLRNPFVCGQPARRHFPHHGERVRRDNGQAWKTNSAKAPRDQWIRPERAGAYEPACTVEHWELIQQALDARRLHRCKTGEANGWCRELVRFSSHEGHARLSAKNNGYISMPTYELTGRPRGEHKVYIYRETVHEAANAAIRSLLLRPGWLLEKIARYHSNCHESRSAGPDVSSLIDEARRLERRLDDLLDREQDAAERRDLQEFASIKRKREEHKQRLGTLETQIASLSKSAPMNSSLDRLLVECPDLLEAASPSLWGDHLSDREREVLASAFIEAIICRVEAVPGRWAWRREVEDVIVRPAFRD